MIHAQPLQAIPLSLRKPTFGSSLHIIAGFFFAYRFALTYLGFQSNPRAGSIVSLALSSLLFAVAVVYTSGDGDYSISFSLSSHSVRWLIAYIVLSGSSLLWTAAESIADAAALWTGMVLELGTVLLLIRRPRAAEQTDCLFKGYVFGMLFIGAVAWAGPVQSDLRIGDYDFLHPNVVAMDSAFAFFLAQHLALRNRIWRWACLALGITMLRTLSKTTFVAFLIGEAFYLLRERELARRTKVTIAVISAVTLVAFASLLSTYFELYANAGSGTQVETLTGRTAIWATALSMGLERPWFGHGFYSFRALVPAFGSFEPWHAHNEILQEFFEYGLPGIGVVVGLYTSMLSGVKRFADRAGAAAIPRTRSYGRLVSVLVLFALIHGLTESVNFGLTIPLWLSCVLALSLQQTPAEASAP